MATGDLLTRDGQLQWRTLLLGAGTPYTLVTLEGWWDLPDVRGVNEPRSQSHGHHLGLMHSGMRFLTATFHVPEGPTGNLPVRLDAVRSTMARAENPVEEPLAVQWAGIKYQVYARIRRRSLPLNPDYAAGYTQVIVQFETTDPRIYSLAEYVVSLALAAATSGGLDFGSNGLDFGSGGLDFGPSPTGSVAVTNSGHVDTWPILEIDGPVTGPHIVFADTGRVLHFDPSWAVLSGQTLVIDTRLRTCLISGVSVRQRLLTAQWTSLPVGSSTILYQAAAYSASTVLRVRWRDAYH